MAVTLEDVKNFKDETIQIEHLISNQVGRVIGITTYLYAEPLILFLPLGKDSAIWESINSFTLCPKD